MGKQLISAEVGDIVRVTHTFILDGDRARVVYRPSLAKVIKKRQSSYYLRFSSGACLWYAAEDIDKVVRHGTV